MFYRKILALAVLLSPWVFSLPTEGDWTRHVKEQAVLGLLAYLPVYALWFHNRGFALLLGYLNLMCMFRDNPDTFFAWMTILGYAILYLAIQWIRDDFIWLKKTIAISFFLTLGYGVLQLFHFHPILSLVNSAIQMEGKLFAKRVTNELTQAGTFRERVVIVEGKDYLKKIIYKKTDEGYDTELVWELPTVKYRHMRINGMFGNPNDWLGYILVSFPFIFFLMNKKQTLWVTVAVIGAFIAVTAVKYLTEEHVNVEAGPKTSLAIRSEISKEVFDQYKERWVFGYGLGTFQTQFPKRQKMKTYGLFTYAHNDYLQFLFETGLVGFLFLTGAAWETMKRIQIKDPNQRVLLLSLILFGLCALVSFPAHIAPTFLVAFLAFSLLSKTTHPPINQSLNSP